MWTNIHMQNAHLQYYIKATRSEKQTDRNTNSLTLIAIQQQQYRQQQQQQINNDDRVP